AADVLLAGGEREHEAAPPRPVHGGPADPPGELAQVRLAGGEEAHARTAEARAVAEGLELAHGDLRAERAGPLQKAEGQALGGAGDREGALLPRDLRHRAQILD